ncbi:unnamed protein product [Urochloa decumbens]|uniref:AAA+ ATPase domain-containing protein n=1 Tax=Urochloa decumbens TaxID=240449 RepID=A0ABC9HFJ7_9POAL
MAFKELWATIGSVLAFILGLFSMAMNHETITLWINKIQAFFSPYIQVTIPEYAPGNFARSNFYVAIEAYLSEHCATEVRKLKAELGSHRKIPLFYVDDGQQIIDTFRRRNSGGGGGGSATVWWHAYKEPPVSNVMYRDGQEHRRMYRVSFHRRFRKCVLEEYMPYVIEKGREVIAKNRQLRLFTNNPYPDCSWSHVAFQHPATFKTLAMSPTLKKTIVDDLDAFKKRKEYYAKVGKPWKRGYLLFGPPGTGKSTMISAIANHLEYDVYDLELTAVKSNNDLRRLFTMTTGKSIIVIEDIDCSAELTDKRRDKMQARHNSAAGENVSMLPPMMQEAAEKDSSEKLTLSGVLNFIDGLWSACGGERIIVFTTNHKDRLDPALIRRGRMDMHIEMSYCSYEAFKILANNYLEINEQDMFERFGEIQHLLEVAKMSPADVAEHLMRKEKDASACLEGLLMALKEKAEAASKGMQISMEKEDAVEAK